MRNFYGVLGLRMKSQEANSEKEWKFWHGEGLKWTSNGSQPIFGSSTKLPLIVLTIGIEGNNEHDKKVTAATVIFTKADIDDLVPKDIDAVGWVIQ